MGQDEAPFDLLLSWLSPDRDTALKKLTELRRRLVLMLELRGCAYAEDSANEAFIRFVGRLPDLIETYVGDPLPYLYTIAYNVYLENGRRPFQPLPENVAETPQPDDEEDKEDEERLHQCLDKCLDELGAEARELLLGYYRREKQDKIEYRKSLADRLGISANALRIRLYHLRRALRLCVEECLGLRPPTETE